MQHREKIRHPNSFCILKTSSMSCLSAWLASVHPACGSIFVRLYSARSSNPAGFTFFSGPAPSRRVSPVCSPCSNRPLEQDRFEETIAGFFPFYLYRSPSCRTPYVHPFVLYPQCFLYVFPVRGAEGESRGGCWNKIAPPHSAVDCRTKLPQGAIIVFMKLN